MYACLHLPERKTTMNLNLALNNKMLALIVLVLLTAVIVALFLFSTVAHVNVWHLFSVSPAVTTSHY